jgi:hypothetical protein
MNWEKQNGKYNLPTRLGIAAGNAYALDRPHLAISCWRSSGVSIPRQRAVG